MLATGLAGSGSLRTLEISRITGITKAGWQKIFATLQHPTFRLETLKLVESRGMLDNPSVLHLFRYLRVNATVKSLTLDGVHNRITLPTWRVLAEFLKSQHCILEDLHVTDVLKTDNRLFAVLATGLANNSSLRSVSFAGAGNNFSDAGLQSLIPVLQSPISSLESFDLRWNYIDDDTLIAFASALVGNKCLKELLISTGV